MKTILFRLMMALFLCVFSMGARASWETVWSENFNDYASTYWLVETGKWTKEGSCSFASLSTNSYNSSQQLKLGTKSDYGIATTPAIGHAGNLRFSFTCIKSAGYTQYFTVSVTGGGSISETETSFTLDDDTYRSATFNITNATAATKIVFTSGGVGGALIDNIVVEKEVEGSTQTVEAPTFTPSGGTYTETQTVAINCETEGATIYYTTDGTTPTNESTPYTEAVSVSTTMTLKAIAYKDDVASDVTTATYTVRTNLFADDFSSEPNGYKALEITNDYVTSKIDIGRSAILTFRLRGRKASATTSFNVVENYGEGIYNTNRYIYNILDLSPSQGEWTDYTYAVPMQYDNSKVKISFYSSDCDLDDVLLVAPPTITLDESANNSTVLHENIGKIVDVATRRTLRGGIWNTLCLPFDVSSDDIYTAIGTGGKTQEIVMTTYSSYADGVMTFSNVPAGTKITAGTPFLLKFIYDCVNPTFRAVKITTEEPATPTASNGVSFLGCFSVTPLATNGTDLFIGTDNKLYSPAEETNNLGGLRAYIHKENPAARLALTIEEPTGIVELRNVDRGTRNDTWYTLDGRKVVSGQLKSGLYISNGKKIVVKR